MTTPDRWEPTAFKGNPYSAPLFALIRNDMDAAYDAVNFNTTSSLWKCK